MSRIYRATLLCMFMLALGDDAVHAGDKAGEPSVPDRAPSAGKESAVLLPEVRVRGEPVREGEKDFYISGSTTGTRMPVPIEDVPQSIEVVPHKIIQDQRILYPNQALRNVSGVDANQPIYSEFQRYNIRGFPVTSFYKDSLLDIGFDRTYWLGNIDRIEVLKGPSSALYGNADPGGTINYISTKPLAEPTFTALGSIGNYNFLETLFDSSGPVTKDKSVKYRLIGDFQDSDSFIDRFHNKGKFLSGAVDVQLNDNTDLTIRSEIRERAQKQFGRVGLPAYGTIIGLDEVRLPLSRNFNEPFADRKNFEAFLGVELLHRSNNIWSFRSQTRVTHFHFSQDRITTRLAADNRTLNRDVFFVDANHEDYRTNNTAIAKFQTLGIRHQLLLGLELAHQPISYKNSVGDLASINIVNPVYGAQPTNVRPRNDQSIELNTAGLYIQDLITLFPNLKLMLGGRYDYVGRDLSDSVTGADHSDDNTRFSPRVGLVYEPLPGVSLYASYSTSFTPVANYTSIRGGDNLFDPETGEQYEIGMKLDISPRLTATLAGYQLTRKNVLTSSPTDPGVSIAVGEQRSRGFELDLTYKIMQGWNVLAAYAYTDAEVTKDNTIAVGNRPSNVPRNSARLWSSYSVQSGALAGLTVGAGAYYADERYGDANNSFKLPSYTIVDASVSYPWDRYTFSLKINNLLDKRYFEAASNSSNVFVGQPFTVLGTITATF